MKYLKWLGVGTIVSSLCLLLSSINSEAGVSVNTAGKQHIGTFEGSTTFTTSSSNGINPGLFIEVRDADGKLQQYASEEGVITVPNTKEGAYVTQAKLLGKTKYVDQETGEILDEWEEGRNLKLESSKMPVLTTVGKNLFDGVWYQGYSDGGGGGTISQPTDLISAHRSGYIEIKPNTNYIFTSYNHSDNRVFYNIFDTNLNKLTTSSQGVYGGQTIVNFSNIDANAKYVVFHLWSASNFSIADIQVQLEEGSAATSYEPYKSNILTVNEGVTLRSNGDVYDELNLLTGRLTQRIDENNEILSQEVVKTVDLTSTYQFNLVSDSIVHVKGDVQPTIYSITVPSEPLTFAINPNAEEGQQFIAPDFSITNESKGPVFLELKSFQQITNIFNDVLPDKHEDWVQLTKDESKDIALALVPSNSDGWLTLNEGPKYVANTENVELGGIRAGATVNFSFNAYHGRVFDQNLFPEYRLVFTFGF